MTKQLLKLLEQLKLYTQIQSKRIDLLEKRLKELIAMVLGISIEIGGIMEMVFSTSLMIY